MYAKANPVVTVRAPRFGSMPDLRCSPPSSPLVTTLESPTRTRRFDSVTAPSTPSHLAPRADVRSAPLVLSHPVLSHLVLGSSSVAGHTSTSMSPDPKLWRGVMLDSTSERLSEGRLGRHISGSVDYTSGLTSPMLSLPPVVMEDVELEVQNVDADAEVTCPKQLLWWGPERCAGS